MSSDDEACPSGKRIKLDTADPINDVRSINKLFPKIDNLEHFPLKVLLNIFASVDDIDLHNLAEESSRFESIAKIVLNERYTHQYFVVDESKVDWMRKYITNENLYISFFRRFGEAIKAVEIKRVFIYGKDHWPTRLLDETKNLEKLTLDRCQIDYKNLLSHVGKNIKHLILHDAIVMSNIFMPEFHKLKKLDIRMQAIPVISSTSMAEILCNNLELESLALIVENNGIFPHSTIEPYPFSVLMDSIGTHLHQLKELTYVFDRDLALSQPIEPIRQPDNVVDAFVNSLKHLESLTLSSTIDYYTNFYGLLRRLNSECTNIKHLSLYDIDAEDTQIFDIIRAFENIESLALKFYKFEGDIELTLSMIEQLPTLRHLTISLDINDSIESSFILGLLQRSSTLEELIFEYKIVFGGIERFGTTPFHDEFIESIQNPNVKFQIKFNDRIIGTITKDEIIWRNKLVHWVGHGPNQNSSGINLLDLATKPQDATHADQPSPFDLILGHLDLNSLYSCSQTNQKCLQLVENHVKQHSRQNGTFIITNEFSTDYDRLEMFAEHVTNLRADIFNESVAELYDQLKKFHNLNMLNIYTDTDISPNEVIVPQVRHLIFDGPRFLGYPDLYELSCHCPDLGKLELKREIFGGFRKTRECLKFRKLKKFKLKYNNHSQQDIIDLKILFKDTYTKLWLSV